ncbi:hypothetical protein KAR91_09225 [Candidatus Pacearchaeota archaeon]|nr:hypothetical protein [Candidatus Pacearchaeota archaeon]
MTEQDKNKFEEIMRGLAENVGATITKEGLRFRFLALQAFDIEQITKAAYSIVATRKYTTMPTIADFIEHFQGGSADDLAQIQAGQVWKALKDCGSYDDIVFDDPVTMAVVHQGFGGWQKLCSEMNEDQMQWFVKDFAKIYSAYARRGIKRFGTLPGIYGAKTRFVGCQDKCNEIAHTENEDYGVGILGISDIVKKIGI